MISDLVTIIIPVYNAEKHLSDCLSSLLKQTYDKIEIVFIDDGSTDRSQQILREFCQQNHNAKLVTQENKGPASARNLALKYINGEYFYLADADDVIDPIAISTFVSIIKSTKSDLVSSNFKFIKNSTPIDKVNFSKNKIWKYTQINNKDDIISTYLAKFKSNFSRTCWNKLYRTEVLQKIPSYPSPWNDDVIMGDDCYFLAQYLLQCNSVVCVKGKFYCYRKSDNSLLRTKKNFDPKYNSFLYCLAPLSNLNEVEFKKTIINKNSLLCQHGLQVLSKMYKSKYKNIDEIKQAYLCFRNNLPYAKKTYKNFFKKFYGIFKLIGYIKYKKLIKK